MSPRAVLIVRGSFSLFFAIYLCTDPAQSAKQALHINGWYALVDGLLAVALAVAAQGDPRTRWLVGPIGVDAVARVAMGAFVLAYPDLQDLILPAVFFYSATIVLCIALGVAGLLYLMVAKRAASGYRFGTAWPLILISVCTLVFGVCLAFGFSTNEGRRTLVASNALLIGFTLLAAGISFSKRVNAS